MQTALLEVCVFRRTGRSAHMAGAPLGNASPEVPALRTFLPAFAPTDSAGAQRRHLLRHAVLTNRALISHAQRYISTPIVLSDLACSAVTRVRGTSVFILLHELFDPASGWMGHRSSIVAVVWIMPSSSNCSPESSYTHQKGANMGKATATENTRAES